MNLDHDPTPDQLRDLLAACNDRAAHHVLWVARNGDVHLSRIPKHLPPDGLPEQPEMQLRFETFEAGNDYVGPAAAAAPDWVPHLFESMMAEWARAKNQPAVVYTDSF